MKIFQHEKMKIFHQIRYWNMSVEKFSEELDHGVDINTMFNGSTLLHLTVSNGQYEHTLLLLQRGADPNMKNGYKHRTPLHIAITDTLMNQEKMIGLLLQYNANVDAKDINGMTPLDLAQRYPKINGNIISILKERIRRKTLCRFYILGRLFQQRSAGILVETKICQGMVSEYVKEYTKYYYQRRKAQDRITKEINDSLRIESSSFLDS